MIIEAYQASGDIRVLREAADPVALSIEEMVDIMLSSPDCPDYLELAPVPDAIDEFTHGMFETRSAAVTFLVHGKKQGNIVNDAAVKRFNLGLSVLLPSCAC